tara:strand:+ start:842 stop:1036 length:195 start_codon:yes stop_codon:yes gene_type:complete
MQKLINVLAIASAAVSIAVVGSGAYVYFNKDALIEKITEKAIGSLTPKIPQTSNFSLPIPNSPL